MDIHSRDIDTIINLGDSLYGPLDPKGTFELLESNKVLSISGNQDLIILENLNNTSDLITLEFVKSQLNAEIAEWLRQLPFDTTIGDSIYCCHASPHSDSEYLLEKLEAGFVAVKDLVEIEELLIDITQKIVVCGHSHISKS